MAKYRSFIPALGLLVLTASMMPVVADTKAVSDFSFKDLTGKSVTRESLAGHAVIYDVWATYCEPCKAEMADFMNLRHKYQSKGLEIVGISIDQEGAAIVKPYVDRNHIDYPIVIGDVDSIQKAFQPLEELPTAFFVDAKGNIHAKLTGKKELPELEKNAQEILGLSP
jgi:thiol-disulfide isomerase/thioredoxin